MLKINRKICHTLIMSRKFRSFGYINEMKEIKTILKLCTQEHTKSYGERERETESEQER